jgi:hypothetical protein
MKGRPGGPQLAATRSLDLLGIISGIPCARRNLQLRSASNDTPSACIAPNVGPLLTLPLVIWCPL